eukprot:3494540-Pyramimonas_sp.AAC.1
MDMWKCFGTVEVRVQSQEARGVGFPLRLLWQLVTSYKMPRAVKGIGSRSFSTRGGTGQIAWLHPCHDSPHSAHDSDLAAGAGAWSHGVPSSFSSTMGPCSGSVKDVKESTVLAKATRELKSGMRRLGLLVQPVTSGY